MRNRALSVLRARQLIITMPRKQLIVLTWTLQLPGDGGAPENHASGVALTVHNFASFFSFKNLSEAQFHTMLARAHLALWLALAAAPVVLADSRCDYECRTKTGLIDCGVIRDCINDIDKNYECRCTLNWWMSLIIAIAVISFTGSCFWQCCGGKKLWHCFKRECCDAAPPDEAVADKAAADKAAADKALAAASYLAGLAAADKAAADKAAADKAARTNTAPSSSASGFQAECYVKPATVLLDTSSQAKVRGQSDACVSSGC
jgi:hypothetical protein